MISGKEAISCTAIAANQMPLETHIRGALASGDLSVEDLREFSMHLSAYGGFPMAAPLEALIPKVAAEIPQKKK